MAFAQLTYRTSLRDIETCLRAQQPRFYHMGFRGRVSRATLADANETRGWRIYRDFAQELIGLARDLYREESFGVELSETVYAFDSTTIDLCLSLLPWGQFRPRKSAVKLHRLFDVRGSIPTSVYVIGGLIHDVNLLDGLLLEAGAFYLFDRGYVDFARLYGLTQACAFFITRAKENMQFYRRASRPVERSTGVRCDRTILLTGIRTAQYYPDPLRRIRHFDAGKDSRLTFLTNNSLPPALTVAQLYQACGSDGTEGQSLPLIGHENQNIGPVAILKPVPRGSGSQEAGCGQCGAAGQEPSPRQGFHLGPPGGVSPLQPQAHLHDPCRAARGLGL